MFHYRKAVINDIETLVHLRKLQLMDEGIEPNIDIDRDLYSFFESKLSDGSLVQWLVEDDEEVIACGAVIFYEKAENTRDFSHEMNRLRIGRCLCHVNYPTYAQPNMLKKLPL